MIRIEALYYYPIKSCAGVKTDHLFLEEAGPRFDREWMVVDANGKFITQREEPRLAKIVPSIEDNFLVLKLKKRIQVPLTFAGKKVPAQVWEDEVEAIDQGDEVAEGLKEFLGIDARLVRATKRFTGADKISVRFPDSYPIHLCAEESLEDLNQRIGQKFEMLRFRPNIVISGAKAWDEDSWSKIQFGPVNLDFKKACTRCSIITIDPDTLAKGTEPLKTLANFRRNQKNKVEFGQYLASLAGAELKIGSEGKASAR